MFKILLIGPRTNRQHPEQTGGVIVLFENLIAQCAQNGIECGIIDTNKANYSNRLTSLLHIWLMLLTKTKYYSHISLHGTANDYVFIAPFTILVAKIFGKTVSLRKFAGNFHLYYDKSGFIKKKLIEYALKSSNSNFFETKYLVTFFKEFNKNTFWFPNVREKNTSIKTKTFEKKFVFISQLYKTKGVDEILQTSNLLPDGYTLDLYGPLRDHYTTEYFDNYKANYRGSLKSDDVLATLINYDVLMLPTYYPGEGYPGIVIESLSLGKPVIVTNLESIQEMVDENCAIFVTPKSIEDIRNSIMIFNDNNYLNFSTNALESFEEFNSDVQTSKFIRIISKKE